MNSNRGKRPISMFEVPPMTDKEKENFIKAWKQCIVKLDIDFKNTIIYGTGGDTEETIV